MNKDIFETIYFHALKASSELAAKEGPYETYNGSPVSKVCFSVLDALMVALGIYIDKIYSSENFDF